MRTNSLLFLLLIISSCTTYTKDELTGTWMSDDNVLQINDSLILAFAYPFDYRVYRYDVTMNKLRMSLEDFTVDVAANHKGYNIESLENDKLVLNGRQWKRVSSDVPVLYSSDANKYKIFYQFQLRKISEIPPFPPPHLDEIIGFSCDMGLATSPVFKVEEAIRNQTYDSLISQIYYGTAADFVIAAMAWKKLRATGHVEFNENVAQYIKSGSSRDYYLYYCSVDNFDITSAQSILRKSHFMGSKIDEWLDSLISEPESISDQRQ